MEESNATNIVSDNFPKSLKCVFISFVIYEEITGTWLSIGNKIVTDGTSFFAGKVKDKPAKSCISEPESDSVIFELYND